MNEPIAVRFKRLPHNPDLPLPARQTPGSAGHDVASAEPDFSLAPGERRAVGTGLAFELPDGIEMQVRPRSGLAKNHQVTVVNAPGTIDADFRGHVMVLLINLGREPFTIASGERIAHSGPPPLRREGYIKARFPLEPDRALERAGLSGRPGRIAADRTFHLSVQNGTIPLPTPIVLGHEGAGIVEEIRQRYALDHIATAHRDLEAGRTSGSSIVLA